MKKSSLLYWILVCFGFLGFTLGVMLLMVGALQKKDTLVLAGIIALLLGAAFYVALAIVLAIHYLKKRRKSE